MFQVHMARAVRFCTQFFLVLCLLPCVYCLVLFLVQ